MKSQTITIRDAGGKDEKVLAGIIRESFRGIAGRFGLTRENCPKHPSNCTAQWIESDLARGVQYYLLLSDDRPVGCVGLESPSPDLCYLERLAVLPEMRHKGLGGLLVRHALELAASKGARRMSIGIIAEQAELRDWYGKFGFEDVQIKEFEHLPFQVRLMELNLANSAHGN